jgi:hypothetical protein
VAAPPSRNRDRPHTAPEAAALSMEGVHQICEKCDKVLFADDPIKRA